MAHFYFKTIWISDVHLGARDCKVDFLGEFLDAIEAESIYLVGDIIDLQSMEHNWYWPGSHQAILRKLIAKARQGTKVVYIPGNHDEALKGSIGSVLGAAISIVGHAFHETADGRRLMIIHGDQFDEVIKRNALLTLIGGSSYEFVQIMNRGLNRLRNWLGYPYWSLSAFFKSNLKNVVLYMDQFETTALQEAIQWRVDGVVCGHIHRPNLQTINGMLYCNDGDWVENCTALAEHPDGRLELLHWLEVREQLYRLPRLHSAPAVAMSTKALSESSS